MKKTISYVSNNGQFYADTVEDYNNYDDTTNCDHFGVCSGNTDIGINVGGDTYLPLNFPIFMYEYGWVYGGQGPGNSSSYYVGILQYNSTQGLGYFLTTQYTNNPSGYDYYYSGSGWDDFNNLHYYFLEDNTGNIQGDNGGSNYFAFMPPDQQKSKQYDQYGVFWLYNWFQANNNNMNIFFLMNGNIFNYSLASEQYSWDSNCWLFRCSSYSANAIPPNPPASTITGEPIFTQSYINAYNTAFNQPNNNYQKALNEYQDFNPDNININNFVPGTFGSREQYNSLSQSQSITIHHLQDIASVYDGIPYLFVSAGSGGGSGYMYLDWVIVTYGVPYVVSVS